MRLRSVKMFPIMLGWKFTLWISCRQFKERSLVHTISVCAASRESTVMQITDIRYLQMVTDTPHWVWDTVYFQSAPKPAGQEVAKEKTTATQNWNDLGQARQEVLRRS